MLNLVDQFEKTVKKCWNNPALTDFRGDILNYSNVAKKIAVMHLVWRAAGVKVCDKISINARSCTSWAIAFMPTISGGGRYHL